MDRNQVSSATAPDPQWFSEHLKRVLKIVQSWPKWKQTVLNDIRVVAPNCEQSERTQNGMQKNEK